MSALRERYLAELGIARFRLRVRSRHAAAAGAAERTVPEPPAAAHAGVERANAAAPGGVEPADAARDDVWDALAAEARACTRCALHRGRTQAVFGVGRRDAALMVIGEAPGAEEDRQGEPFVGRAGRLLDAMLRAIGLPRQEVYIANILKCRPPGNRDPRPEEAAACTPFLDRQLALVRPRVVLAVGRVSAQWLLQSDAPIGRLRGQIFQIGDGGTPLVVTYHPAYLLRTPIAKAKTWEDLCAVRRLLS